MSGAGETYDVAVVGAGGAGLAHAYVAGRRGLRVVVVDGHDRCRGASVRDFGMIRPIGQPDGPRRRTMPPSPGAGRCRPCTLASPTARRRRTATAST